MGFFSRKNKSKNKNKGNEGGVDASDTVAPNLIPSDSVEFNKSAPDATFSNDDPTSASFSAIATDNSAATQKTTGAATMKVDYDANPTLLYKFIEYRDWEAALEHCAVAPDDARTWVIRYEDYKDSDECSECDYETKVIRWKMLPIHVAIVFNAPVRLVTAILEAYPAAIQETDDRKMAPIHLACRSLTNLNVAQYLIIKSTDALSMTDCKGRTALAILKEYRDKNAKKTDEDSKGELKNRDVLIKMIMQKMGIKETQQKEFRSLSDSECSSKGADDDSREVSLGDDNRSATNSIETGSTSGKGSTFTDEGNSRKSSSSAGAPIVLSNSSNSQETGILKNPNAKCIAEKSLENDMQSGVYSIIPKDQAGKNYMKRKKKAKKPVNEADYDVKPSVLIKLIEKKMWKQANTRCVDYPEEASIWMCRLQKVQGDDNINKDVRWKILPIHSAIVLHSPVEVIESLVDAYPQGLRKGDDRNMLPLHMAFRLGSSPETTAVLVDAYPDALKKRDSKGHTPLHILKAYRRKYKKERASGKQKSKGTFMDENRKQLIRFYLGGRKYGVDDDATLAPYDSDGDESEVSGDSTIFFEDDDEDVDYDRLFYKNMFNDFSSLAAKGFSTIPGMVRDSLACRT